MCPLEFVGPCMTSNVARRQVVCRDVWALHLSLLPTPPTAEPYFHAQSQYGGPSAASDPQTAEGKPVEAEDKHNSDDIDNEDAKSTSSWSTGEEDDMSMEDLLRENSVAPSSSSEDDDGDGSHPGVQQDRRQRKNKTTFRPFDSPAANIAILMLACWTLRLPLTYMDFKR